jgi:hypothetical protein
LRANIQAGGLDMGVYILAGIVFMTFAAIVVTKEPEEKDEYTPRSGKKKAGGQVTRRLAERLSTTPTPVQK